VIPMIVSRSAGSPYTRAATGPSTSRGLGTTSAGRPAAAAAGAPAGSVSTATAPAAAAAATNSAPCRRAPGSAAYRSPGTTCSLLWVTPVTDTRSAVGAASPSNAARSVSGQAATRAGRSKLTPGTAVEVTVPLTATFTGTADMWVVRPRR